MMTRPTTPRDQGSVLPLVLVVSVIMAIVVAAVATYAATTLRSGQEVEARADRLATADAAMEDALENLQLRRQIGALCGTLAGSSSGVSAAFPEVINGASASVNCRIVGGVLPPTDGWALVVTGLQGGSAPGTAVPPGQRTFVFTNGGTPEIGGPVYVHDPSTSRMDFSQPTTIVEGDVWYPDNTCAGAGSDIKFERSTVGVDNDLAFDPATRGVYCLNRTWVDLFGAGPDLGAVPAGAVSVDPAPDANGCKVFSPGVYTSQPVLGNNNYFQSGNYEFRNIGLLEIKGQAVHMGNDPTLGNDYPVTENSVCDFARQNDPNVNAADPATFGATLYTSGNTQIEAKANGSFEISRRQQTYQRPGFPTASVSLVAMHVINSSLAPNTPILLADNGNKKQIALNGLFWAPYSYVYFDTVPSEKAAVLRGGAVIGRFEGGVTASASGFVIEVPTSSASTKLLLTATATDTQGDTAVRVVADYRPTSGETAVNSWRVVN
jgi:type II secretory pathway pseudopilin PulG